MSVVGEVPVVVDSKQQLRQMGPFLLLALLIQQPEQQVRVLAEVSAQLEQLAAILIVWKTLLLR